MRFTNILEKSVLEKLVFFTSFRPYEINRICPKSRLKSAKRPLPVDVRRPKTSLFKVLLKIVTENGIYSPFVKVISNSIFLFILYAAPSSKLRAGVTRNGAIFSMEPPHYWKRSEGILLRSPTLIIANITATGTRAPTHGLAST